MLVLNCPGAKLSGVKLSWGQIFLVPNCPVPNCPTTIVCRHFLQHRIWIYNKEQLEAIGRRHRTEERSQYSPAIQFFNRPLKSSLLCSEERLRWKRCIIYDMRSLNSVACFGPVGSPPRPKLLSLLTGQEGSNPFDKGAQFQRVLP